MEIIRCPKCNSEIAIDKNTIFTIDCDCGAEITQAEAHGQLLKEGVKAIIFLQKLVGIDEPVDKATQNWNNFADWEKEATLSAYRTMNTGDS